MASNLRKTELWCRWCHNCLVKHKAQCPTCEAYMLIYHIDDFRNTEDVIAELKECGGDLSLVVYDNDKRRQIVWFTKEAIKDFRVAFDGHHPIEAGIETMLKQWDEARAKGSHD